MSRSSRLESRLSGSGLFDLPFGFGDRGRALSGAWYAARRAAALSGGRFALAPFFFGSGGFA